MKTPETTLIQAIRTFCVQHALSLQGKTILCALSGGRDSVGLLWLLQKLGRTEGFSVTAAHYNHHLRETAQRDESFVRTLCTSWGIPLSVGGGDVAGFARIQGTSTEDAGRILRYRFLEETAQEMGADFIATAHHAQDNAETVLLHLLRGTGLQGMGGIPPVRGNIIRPLLTVSRTEIDAFVRENALPYVEDESNTSPAYARNRIRHELLPLLEELSSGSVHRIAAAAGRLRSDSDYLEQQAYALLPPARPDGTQSLPYSLLQSEPEGMALRLVRLAARQYGIALTAAQNRAILELKAGGVLHLPNGVLALREKQQLHFRQLPPAPPPLLLHFGTQQWGSYHITVRQTTQDIPADHTTLLLRADTLPLTLTRWDGTGRLTIANGQRTVKRLLADHGIPPIQRYDLPAVFAGDTLVAVCGAGTDARFTPCGNEKLVITLAQRG